MILCISSKYSWIIGPKPIEHELDLIVFLRHPSALHLVPLYLLVLVLGLLLLILYIIVLGLLSFHLQGLFLLHVFPLQFSLLHFMLESPGLEFLLIEHFLELEHLVLELP